MRTCARIIAIVGLLVGFAGFVAAQNSGGLNVHLSIQKNNPVGDVRDPSCWKTPGRNCSTYGWVGSGWWLNQPGVDNNPYAAWGDATFSSTAPTWADSYTSDLPTQWQGQCYMMQCTYQAIYGEGGSITVNGPNGMVFTGVLTDGTYNASWDTSIDDQTVNGNETATFDFTGTWSNGMGGYGTVYNNYSFTEHHGPDGSSGRYSNIAKLDMYQTN
jgi:hypothetical protein